MSSVNKDKVHKIAQLAHIELTEAQEEAYSKELDSILNWIEKLQSVDTSNVLPMHSPIEGSLKMRQDLVDEHYSLDIEKLPYTKYGYFRVPKFVE